VLHSLALLLVLVTQGGDLVRIALRLGTFFEIDSVLGVLMVGLLQLVVLQAYMLYLGFSRQPAFRAWAMVLMVLAMALDLGLMLYVSARGGPQDPDSLLVDFVQIGISLATLAYLAVSRRVRVTYQWLVSADDPALEAVTKPPPDPAGSRWLERYLEERP
jgi:hypothetical protein